MCNILLCSFDRNITWSRSKKKKYLPGYACKIHVCLHVLSIAPTSKVVRQFFVQFSKTKFYKGSSVVHENVICLQTVGQTDGQSEIYRHLAGMRWWQKFLRLGIGPCFKTEMSRTRIFCLGHISPSFHQLLVSRAALQWHILLQLQLWTSIPSIVLFQRWATAGR